MSRSSEQTSAFASLPSLLACLALSAFSDVSPSRAAEYRWLSEVTPRSSKELVALQRALFEPGMDGVRGVPVRDLHWTEQQLDLHLIEGTIFLEPPLQGVPLWAYFSGQATVTYRPPSTKARQDLLYWCGGESLEREPVTEVLFFTLRGATLLQQLGVDSQPSVSFAFSESYGTGKRALAQLGKQLLEAFLNREGRSRNAAWVVMAPPAIRIAQSREAYLLYSFDPGREREIELAVTGHREVKEYDPEKWFWSTLTWSRLRGGRFDPPATVQGIDVDLKLERAMDSAAEDTTLELVPEPGVSALQLALTPRLEVQSVTGPGGEDLPFLQWQYLPTEANYDQAVLIWNRAPLPAGQKITLRIRATGRLFEPDGRAYRLIDEDNWLPRLEGSASAIYDIQLTVPQDMQAAAPGQLMETALDGNDRRFRFRTKRPQKSAVVYFGDYKVVEGQVDGITLNLFVPKMSGYSQKDVEFARAELENALYVYGQLFGPLDSRVVRVVDTPNRGGRGFDGLILLGSGGAFGAASSSNDTFRAHEYAHQWWGNVVQPRNWPEDRWLSESFAEFSAMEYFRIRYEKPHQVRERIFLDWVRPLVEAPKVVITNLKGQKSEILASESSSLIDGGRNVYNKGPLVLHMLRYLFQLNKGNDQAFWDLLRQFIERHRYQEVTTAEFCSAAESALGVDLDWFWDQWLSGTKLPRVQWKAAVKPKDGKFLVTVNAEQQGTSFSLSIPVYIHLENGTVVRRPLALRGARGEFKGTIPEKPARVTVNDNYEALAILRESER